MPINAAVSAVSTYSTDSLCTHQRYSLTETSVELKNVDQQRPSDLHIRQTTENMGPLDWTSFGKKIRIDQMKNPNG